MTRTASGERSATRLWIDFLGAPIIWSLHFVVVYGLNGAACSFGWAGWTILGMPVALLMIGGVTVLAVGLTLVTTISARRTWRATRDAEQDGVHRPARRSEYMGFMGAVLGMLFAVLMALEAISMFLVDFCEYT